MNKQSRIRARLSKKDTVNKTKPRADEPVVIQIRNSAHKGSRFFNSVDPRVMQVQVQTRPLTDPRVLMTSKACDAVPEVKDVALRTGSTTMEPYDHLLLQQYGFNPHLPEYLEPLMPIDKVVTCPVPRPPKVDYSSQCVNPTTTTGTNGTTIDNLYNFGTGDVFENRNGLSPKDIEISETPRMKVISEKFTRFKKDHIELRRLEERVICVEYDVYSRNDLVREPIQVMRAYFCVKTSCKQCQNSGIFKTVPSSIKNSPLMEEDAKNDLERELEMIDEKLPENKPYLRDLRTVLKKRQAMLAKKKKSSLDLMSMYLMAKNEMSPRDHDWSNTNLLSKAELQEVKYMIMKQCESRMYNLSRKKMKIRENVPSLDTNYASFGKFDSLYADLFRDLDSTK